jgi:murein DD-endopeptidase MepM/ murein hydrolase activator NlpD
MRATPIRTLIVVTATAIIGSAAAAPIAGAERRCEGHTGVSFEEQIRACTKVIAAKPSRARLAIAHFNRGWALNLSGRYDRALPDFDKAITLEPDFEQAFRSKGDVYRRKGMIKQAIAEFDRAIAIKPDYATAFADRALAYQALGKVDQALQDFDKAIALLPDIAQNYFSRAQVHEHKGTLDAALADLDRAVTLEPNAARHLAARGRVKARLGRNDLAAADFEAALKLDARLIGPRRWLKQFEETKPQLRGSATASLPASAGAFAAATPVKTVAVRLTWPICRKTRTAGSTKPQADQSLRIPATFGEHVQASAAGVVVAVDPKSATGNLIEVRHDGGLVTEYGYLSATFVQPSDLVQQGQVIGQVGTNDRAEARLHFAAYRDDQPIDPLTALPVRPPSCRTK